MVLCGLPVDHDRIEANIEKHWQAKKIKRGWLMINVYWVLHFKSTFQKPAPWQASWNKAIMCVLAVHHIVDVPGITVTCVGHGWQMPSEDLRGVSGYLEEGFDGWPSCGVFLLFWPKTTPIGFAEISFVQWICSAWVYWIPRYLLCSMYIAVYNIYKYI